MTATTIEPTATEAEPTRTLITGGDPDAPFKVPILLGDFRDAPELKRIGDALIAACEELEDLRWAIEEDGFEIAYQWKKKATKSADKFVAGKQGKLGGLAKHFASEAKGARVGYTVTLAADANYGQTNWQIEARVFHELYHCKIGRKTVGKGEAKHTVPVLKVRGHDLEMFWAERRRYGDWHAALEQGQKEFTQQRLPMEGNTMPRQKSSKNRSGAEGPVPKETDPNIEKPASGHYSASGATSPNGSHDPDAGLLYDPDRVCRTLADDGWAIAYQTTIEGDPGRYVNPATDETYGIDAVESAYRGLIAGR